MRFAAGTVCFRNAAIIAALDLENGNGGYQVSQIGAGLVKASLVFADCLADLIAFPAQSCDCSYLGHAEQDKNVL
jgi:hypothetical protein